MWTYSNCRHVLHYTYLHICTFIALPRKIWPFKVQTLNSHFHHNDLKKCMYVYTRTHKFIHVLQVTTFFYNFIKKNT